MSIESTTVDCPACWGRGNLTLIESENPRDHPCPWCACTGRVPEKLAEEIREEARRFVAEAIRKHERGELREL